MIKRCPGGFPKQTISDLLKNALNLACYDPNYLYNEDDSEMADAGDNDDWGSDFDDDQQNMEDDDDTSWKVRRGAFRIIQSIILTRPELRSDLIDNCTVKLADRFKERIDDVKCELLEAFRLLVASEAHSSQLNKFTAKIIPNLLKQAKSKNIKV